MRLARLDRLEGLLGALGAARAVTLILEDARDELTNIGLIIDDENISPFHGQAPPERSFS